MASSLSDEDLAEIKLVLQVRDLYERRYPRSKAAAPAMRSSRSMPKPDFGGSSLSTTAKSNKPPIHPQVTFKTLPFYDVLSDVIKPSSLITRAGRDHSKGEFTFTLSEEQVRVLADSRRNDPIKRYQVQIQLRFCLLETTCDQKDFLPPNLSVQMNRTLITLPPYVPPSKAGLEPKRANRPIDITLGCILCDVSRNKLEVSWMGDFGKNYALCINVVRPLSSDILLQRLRKKGIRPQVHSQALITEKLARDPDSEIATTSLKVSLLCPLGKMRMTVPARPLTCTHMQCFDAMLFLQMNERKATWMCPVCDRPAEFSQLFIDGLFINILKETTSGEVIFLDNGRWEPFSEKKEFLSLVTPTKKADLIGVLCASKRKSGSAKDQGSLRKVSQDIMEVVTPKVTPRRKVVNSMKRAALDLSSSPQSSPAGSAEQKKREPVIIDLTCDSSDEESCIASPAKRKDTDRDEIHSLSSTSPYRSDSSMHRDDSLVGPPEKQRRTHDALPWEQCGTSFSGLPQNLPSSASSSPRPSCFGLVDLNSAERTSQSARSRQPVYYPPITRSSGSPMSMYGFDQYRTGPSPSLLDMNYYLSSLDHYRMMQQDSSARSSPFLNQQSHISPSADALRALYPGAYRLPSENSDIIPID